MLKVLLSCAQDWSSSTTDIQNLPTGFGYLARDVAFLHAGLGFPCYRWLLLSSHSITMHDPCIMKVEQIMLHKLIKYSRRSLVLLEVYAMIPSGIASSKHPNCNGAYAKALQIALSNNSWCELLLILLKEINYL